ncbi:tyrosine-type recombinase/integrase, partial [Tautonia rosea]|uniref:tyrosine-type recombinase/integrase n=1 Tax=Tautonia rosea TaxID=2728037 RepID=UPI00160044C7
VRDGKGRKDRVTLLPEALRDPIARQIDEARAVHAVDLAEGYGCVYLPDALARKYPSADREPGWQYLFPASRRAVDPRSGVVRRHHLDERALQRAVKDAVRAAGIAKPATCHPVGPGVLRGQLGEPSDIRTVQELLGHQDVRTTMIYTHVLQSGPLGVRSPIDLLIG